MAYFPHCSYHVVVTQLANNDMRMSYVYRTVGENQVN